MIRSFILAIVLIIGVSFSKAQDVNYKSQSLYIYLFTKNITWPAMVQKQDVFKIAVYGTSPIIGELQIMASLKKTPQGQRILVEQIADLDQLSNYQIVYIPASKSRELKSILDKLKDSPTLLVAERGGLAKKGAAINFVALENDNLKFEVNKQQLAYHNLKMADALLQKGYAVN